MDPFFACCNSTYRLRYWNWCGITNLLVILPWRVATVLTVYGIETSFAHSDKCLFQFMSCNSTYRLRYWNWVKTATKFVGRQALQQYLPFTVLKRKSRLFCVQHTQQLQQYLPFTVLKLKDAEEYMKRGDNKLQQYLPFTVLKRDAVGGHLSPDDICCNSTYRLRYWNRLPHRRDLELIF